jgi:taurine dioxygenase
VNVRRRGYALGAEILGLDASQALDDGTIAAVRQALLDNVVICVPGQSCVGPAELAAFCRRFGEPDTYNTRPYNRHPECPEVFVVANKPVTIAAQELRRSVPANVWHSDYSYSRRPGTITFLLAKAIPEVGGDTQFANAYTAYETLSPTLQGIVESLAAVHDVTLSPGYALGTPEQQAKDKARMPPVVHPVVRIHPETGRKALYVAERIRNFVGMSEEETRPLLGFLKQHSVRYEFTYRHRWATDDLVLWDNRCALHYAVQDYERAQLRQMLRISLVGPESGRLA